METKLHETASLIVSVANIEELRAQIKKTEQKLSELNEEVEELNRMKIEIEIT